MGIRDVSGVKLKMGTGDMSLWAWLERRLLSLKGKKSSEFFDDFYAAYKLYDVWDWDYRSV